MLPLERTDALTIGQLYGQVETALSRAFRGRQVWVRGEIQSITDRTGHCYMDLVDPDGPRGRDAAVLKVKCWQRTWAPLRRVLADQGIVLEVGTLVAIRGSIGLYRAKGEIDFTLSEVDVSALLGRLAAGRAALLETLEAEGLLGRNRSLPVPPVPLRVGLVASPGTEGAKDFLGQLEDSGYAFHILLVPAVVQGPGAPTSIATALATLTRAGCDLAVLVRGGGSRGDLAPFDTEPVARALAAAPMAVWTGIGHTGDQSLADILANRAFITPTECGQEIVRRVDQAWASVAARGDRIGRRAVDALATASRRDDQARGRLVAATRTQLDRHSERLTGRARRIAQVAPRRVELAEAEIAGRAGRLGTLALVALDHQSDRTRHWRRLLAAYDVDRQLERGYTLTLGADGRVLRSVEALGPGTVLLTRFPDGTARSAVEAIEKEQP